MDNQTENTLCANEIDGRERCVLQCYDCRVATLNYLEESKAERLINQDIKSQETPKP